MIQKCYLLFYCVKIDTGGAKGMLGKIAHILAGIQTEALNCNGSHCILSCHVPTGRIIPVSIKNVLAKDNFILESLTAGGSLVSTGHCRRPLEEAH